MVAEILCIGTELLMGQTLNTNAQFLSRRFHALGVSVYHHTVVGDNAARLEEALRLALSRADVVITTGGLDTATEGVSRRVTAAVTGRQWLLKRNTEEIVLTSPNGAAPGAIVSMANDKAVILLPDDLCELEPMFTSQVEPWLASRSGKVLANYYFHFFGMDEAELESKLHDLLDSTNPTLSLYHSMGETTLRLTASAGTEKEARNLLQSMRDTILKKRLFLSIYAEGNEDQGSLAACTVKTLKRRGWTCATCESLTGGMIASALVDVPGASDVMRGGLVTYQTDTKTLLADVPAELIEQHGVVSAEVAKAMAWGVRRRLGVDVAVSATGLAGPDGGTPEKPVGTVFIGVSRPRHTRVIALQLSGSRSDIRTIAMTHALNAIRFEAGIYDATLYWDPGKDFLFHGEPPER